MKSAETILQEYLKEEKYNEIGFKISDFYRENDVEMALKYVDALIQEVEKGKHFPSLIAFVRAEIQAHKKQYDKAKKFYYYAITNMEDPDFEIEVKARERVESVCKEIGDLQVVYCMYFGENHGTHTFRRMDTKEMIRVKVDGFVMQDIQIYDFVNVTICKIDEDTTLVNKVELAKKISEENRALLIKKIQENPEYIALKEIKSNKKIEVYEGDLPYIFVSYSHLDSNIVLPIIKELSSRGFRVWFDQGIQAGTEWPQYIAEHIDGCDCVLVCLSKNAEDSVNCRNEINLSCELNKKIIVVRLEEYQMSLGVRLQLGSKQAIFKSRHASFEQFLDELSKAKLLADCKE